MNQDMMKELERLRAENEKLKAQQNKPLTVKVSQKGAFSIYGLGRFPTTLYAKQWRKIFDAQDQIKAFIDANEAEAEKNQEAHLAASKAA